VTSFNDQYNDDVRTLEHDNVEFIHSFSTADWLLLKTVALLSSVDLVSSLRHALIGDHDAINGCDILDLLEMVGIRIIANAGTALTGNFENAWSGS